MQGQQLVDELCYVGVSPYNLQLSRSLEHAHQAAKRGIPKTRFLEQLLGRLPFLELAQCDRRRMFRSSVDFRLRSVLRRVRTPLRSRAYEKVPSPWNVVCLN
ncbi:hypothetical protein DPSP01_011537 [Paraphaeosphaeria sporulosa]